MAILTVSIAASDDDGVWVEGVTAFDGAEVYIPVGHGGAPYGSMNGFLRFAVALDQGTTINSASIDLVADEDRSSSGVRLKIRAILAASPAAPTTYSGAENATRTAAGVDWVITTGWTNGVTYTSPDFAAVLQELVDAYTITAVVVYLEDDASNNNNSRRFASYDANTTPPELTIDYTPPAIQIEQTAVTGTNANDPTTTSTTLSGYAHPGGALVVVSRHNSVNGAQPGTTCDFGGTSIPLIAQESVNADSSAVNLFYLQNVASQTADITVTIPIAERRLAVGAISLSGAGTIRNTSTGSQGPISVTATTVAQDLAFRLIGWRNSSAYIDPAAYEPDQLQIIEDDDPTRFDLSYARATTTSTTLSVNWLGAEGDDSWLTFVIQPGTNALITTITAAGQLQLSGQAHQIGPDVQTIITTSQLQLQGQAHQVGSTVQVAINTGQLQLSGQAHQVGPDIQIVITTGQLQLQGQTFTIDPGTSGVTVTITAAGQLQLSGQAHQVGPDLQTGITTGQLQLQGQPFTVDPGTAIAVTMTAAGQLQLQGQAHSVGAGVQVLISRRDLRLVAYRWTVDPGAGPAVETTITAAGQLQLQGQPFQVGQAIAVTIPAASQLQLLGRPFRLIREAPGLLVGAPTPQTVTLVSANDVDHEAGTISHAVEASANPGAAAALLATDGLGAIQLQRVLIAGDISSPDWVSGQTGFGIEADGTADFRSIFADELTVETFIADVNLALAGSQMITKSIANLAADFTIPTTSATLTVYDLPGLADTAVFADGDWVRLKVIDRSGGGLVVADAWGTVAGYTDLAEGLQSWTWTRQSGTVGLVAGAGGLALDYGQSGDGYWHVTTLQAASPYAEIGTWATDPSNPANHAIHVRLGQLDGIANRGDEWGLWAGSDPTTSYLAASDAGLEAHGLRLSLYEGTSERIRLDPAVPSLAVGLTLPTGPLAGGAGLWAGIDAGAVQVRIGNPAGDHLLYDGSGLAIVGDGSGVTNINGGNIQTGTVTAAQITANTITAGQIAAGTITANEIAANAVTANEIAANAVTAVKINVSTLSAITASMGTVTAGTINGVTVIAGGGDVVLDSDGITLDEVTDVVYNRDAIKWGSATTPSTKIYGSNVQTFSALSITSTKNGHTSNFTVGVRTDGNDFVSLPSIDDDLVVRRGTDAFGYGGTEYTGYIYVPLSGSPAQAAHWNNQSRAVGTYTIGVSGFSGGGITVPSDCKAIAVQIAATNGAAGGSFSLGYGSYYDAVNARISPNDNAAWASGIVNVISGNFKGMVSGGTVNVWIRIVGFYI